MAATMVAMSLPFHPTLLAGLVSTLDEPRLVDHRPPRRARSLRVRRRRA
jgi:hypothetical protein